MKYPPEANPLRDRNPEGQKTDQQLPGVAVRWEVGWHFNGYRDSFMDNEKVLELWHGDVAQR